MLPSRGLLKSSPSLGRAQLGLQSAASTRAVSRQLPRVASRQFGTTQSRNGGSLLGAPGRSPFTGRIGSPIAATTALSFARFPSSSRYASTQTAAPSPPAGADVAASDLPSSLDSLSGSDLLNIPEQIGFLKALGLEYGYGPTSVMEWVTEHLYVYSGLPWWATIISMSVLIRLALLKPSITAADHQGKLQSLNRDPKYTSVIQKFRESAFGPNKDQTAMMVARQEKLRMERQIGFKQWKVFVPMLQLPIAIGMFRLFRDMSALPVPSLETGGLLWFTDLTVSDPYFFLPIVGGLIFYRVLKVGTPYLPEAQKKIMGLMGIVMVPISILVTVWLPASVQLFILLSGGLQYLQTWLLHQGWLRQRLGLVPLVPTGQAPASTGSWQPPRTIDTTGRPAEAPKSESIYSTLKGGISSATEKVGDYSGRKERDGHVAKAQKYEEKRSLQENEQYFARREEKAAKRAAQRRAKSS